MRVTPSFRSKNLMVLLILEVLMNLFGNRRTLRVLSGSSELRRAEEFI